MESETLDPGHRNLWEGPGAREPRKWIFINFFGFLKSVAVMNELMCLKRICLSYDMDNFNILSSSWVTLSYLLKKHNLISTIQELWNLYTSEKQQRPVIIVRSNKKSSEKDLNIWKKIKILRENQTLRDVLKNTFSDNLISMV